jgi:hypothetical protein
MSPVELRRKPYPCEKWAQEPVLEGRSQAGVDHRPSGINLAARRSRQRKLREDGDYPGRGEGLVTYAVFLAHRRTGSHARRKRCAWRLRSCLGHIAAIGPRSVRSGRVGVGRRSSQRSAVEQSQLRPTCRHRDASRRHREPRGMSRRMVILCGAPGVGMGVASLHEGLPLDTSPLPPGEKNRGVAQDHEAPPLDTPPHSRFSPRSVKASLYVSKLADSE